MAASPGDPNAASQLWGPYVSERAWGTVREDYSADADAWSFVTHDAARSYAYRWSEDGLAGISDLEQRLCFAFAFWNGRDPILKERIFGLNGHEGNHGEDAKELWWYLDATPDASWLHWRYVYPQRAFPYGALVDENARRGRDEAEFELVDTGVLTNGFWIVDVTYAKAAADDVCIRVVVRNESAEHAALHVLPTLWFRNTWSWNPGSARPTLAAENGALGALHETLGRYVLTSSAPGELLFCDNESNLVRLYANDGGPAYPKDGIGTFVVDGAASVNPEPRGTKASFHHVVEVAPGESAEIRLRLAPDARPLDEGWEEAMAQREHEADELHASFGLDGDQALVIRQALAGMIWSKQYYAYDVERWLDGDPGQPAPPAGRRHGRNSQWRHLVNENVISMPDKWEYPWYAAWDLAFHTLPLALVDAEFAKEQLQLLVSDAFMHPNGQLPAYEWNFSDVNPPIQAWAALRIFELDGSTDIAFLSRMFTKLLLNFSWWLNRNDPASANVFSGGFLGLDNISAIDRSQLPPAYALEQADATGWMARYALDLMRIALTLADHDPSYEDIAATLAQNFALISAAMSFFWDDADGFYYDQLRLPSGQWVPLRVRSAVGLIPTFAVVRLTAERLDQLPRFAAALTALEQRKPALASAFAADDSGARTFSLVPQDHLRVIAAKVFDEEEFLAPFGLRSLSRFHRDHPYELELDGRTTRVDYEPGESTTALFGGNSNWRGPVWMPLNYLAVEALAHYEAVAGELKVEFPTGSGRLLSMTSAAAEVARRLESIFLVAANGRRPVSEPYGELADDPRLRDCVPFHEYFHADSGAGLGASHQTGWTGLVAMLLSGR